RNALEPAVRTALMAWETSPPGPDRDVCRFLELVRGEQLKAATQRLAEVTKESTEKWHRYFQDREESVAERWDRSGRYGAAVVFEAVYLGLLSLFLCWPLLRGQGRIAWAVHLGLTPFLFMLPAYLGYAIMSFSSAGPSGGIAYPWLLLHVPGSWLASADRQLFLAFPKVLEPLSPPLGPPMALSWRSMPGPATAPAAGGLLPRLAFRL